MRPLIIDRDRLRALRAYAEASPIPYAEMIRMMAGDAPRIGERPGHTLQLPVGFRLAFSIEEAPVREGSPVWIRHLSMGLHGRDMGPGEYPHPAAIEEVGLCLGLPRSSVAGSSSSRRSSRSSRPGTSRSPAPIASGRRGIRTTRASAFAGRATGSSDPGGPSRRC